MRKTSALAVLNRSFRGNRLPRNVAGGVRAPTAQSNGVNTGQNLRSSHVNESGVTLYALAIIYSGWNVDPTNEQNNGNAYTVTASVEYPAGVYTQILWSGATSNSIADGTNQTSDYTTLSVAIPPGAQFWVRTNVAVTAAQFWPNSTVYGTSITSANGEACEVGTSVTDKTMSGTITGSSVGLRPSAIMSQYISGMRPISVCGFGDSTIHGAGDEQFDSGTNTSWIGRGTTGKCPYLMISYGGQTLLSSNAAMSRRLDLIAKAGITHIAVSLASNDIVSDPSFATMQGYLQALWTALATTGAKVYHVTSGPRSTSSDGWFTVANQTPVNEWLGSYALAGLVNDYIRGVPSPLTGYFDKVNILSTGRYSGKWQTGESNPQVRLQAPYNCTATGTPTTTNVPFTPNLATGYTSYFVGGKVSFTSGVLSGVTYSGTLANTLSSITFSTALASAPAAGDTMVVRPLRTAATTDGIHGQAIGTTVTALASNVYGGQFMMMDVFISVLDQWLLGQEYNGGAAVDTVPAQVTGLGTTVGNGQISLAWAMPDSGGRTISDYLVEYKASASGTWLTFAHAASANLGRTVTGLTNSTAYDFRVSAINSVGTGPVSSTATATPLPIFAPTDIANLALWLDAADSGTITAAAGEVSQWNDKSTEANHFTQATAGKFPITGTRTINSLNVLDFDGINDNMRGPTGIKDIGFSACTIFVVYASDNTGDATQNLLYGANSTPAFRMGVQITATLLNVECRTTSNLVTTQACTRNTSTRIAGFNRTGTSITPFVDGTRGTTGTNAENITVNDLVMGTDLSTVANRFNGKIAEVIMYRRSLTTSEENQVGDYLEAKWGGTWP